MTANAVALTQEVQDAVEILGSNNQPITTPEPAVAHSLGVEEMDEFGRTEAERTITLESVDAEAINTEVNDGKHQTYGDALHYVLMRGFAEIKRTRESAQKNAAKTLLADKTQEWTKIMSADPSLVNNGVLVAKMLQEITLLSAKASRKK